MAKQETIKNLFDNTASNVQLDRKYLKFVQEYQNQTTLEAFEAFRTKDLPTIENAFKQLSLAVTSNMYVIGIGCLIIERERLYIKAGYNSYFEYAQYLFDDADLSTSTLSYAKIVMEKFIDYNQQLKKAGFRLERNATKLLFLEEALDNHNDEEEVFRHLVEDSFRKFKEWAQRPARIQYKPEKETRIDAEIKGDKLFVDGKNILNFPKDLPAKTRELVKDDLQRTFTIREGGNLPYIVGTYGRGEQIAIDNLLKQNRAKK